MFLKAERENEIIAQLICEYDDRFNHILGYRRPADWINRLNGTNYSRNRIHRIMKQLNIHSVIRRKKKKYLENSTQRLLLKMSWAETSMPNDQTRNGLPM